MFFFFGRYLFLKNDGQIMNWRAKEIGKNIILL